MAARCIEDSSKFTNRVEVCIGFELQTPPNLEVVPQNLLPQGALLLHGAGVSLCCGCHCVVFVVVTLYGGVAYAAD